MNRTAAMMNMMTFWSPHFAFSWPKTSVVDEVPAQPYVGHSYLKHTTGGNSGVGLVRLIQIVSNHDHEAETWTWPCGPKLG